MNTLQRAVSWFKAIGFPPWQGSYSLSNPTFGKLLSAGDTYSGVTVSGLTALQISAVWGCCNIRGRVMSSFPVDIVQKSGSTRKVLEGHPLADLFEQPNEYMNWFEFMQSMMLSFDLYGNAFAEKVTLGNKVVALWPIAFERVNIKFEKRELIYEVNMPDGSTAKLGQDQVLHVRNFSLDGIIGLSPIQAREVMGRQIAAQRFGATFMRNGARLSLAFTRPVGAPKLSPEAQDKLREDFQRIYAGPENAGRVLFLNEGMEPKTFSISPEDAELLGTMKYGAAEIASMYGVPLYHLGQGEGSPTYASAEQFNRFWVDFTLAPLCVLFQAALKKSLLAQDRGISIKFNLNALLRGDSAARASYHATMVQNGIETRNEARAHEELNAIEGGDELTVQSNMTVLDDLAKLVDAQTRPPVPAEPPPPQKEALPTVVNISAPVTVETKQDPTVPALIRAVDKLAPPLVKDKKTRKNITLVRDKAGMMTGAEVLETNSD